MSLPTNETTELAKNYPAVVAVLLALLGIVFIALGFVSKKLYENLVEHNKDTDEELQEFHDNQQSLEKRVTILERDYSHCCGDNRRSGDIDDAGRLMRGAGKRRTPP